mmetsp:Transcript_34704/g.98501  ORF Transcript_34704/g.98501 Transcript_34704/m.98501 type:complete len:176 (-) Transcript_34704:113-640(-)
MPALPRSLPSLLVVFACHPLVQGSAEADEVRITGINALTLATSDMAASHGFYSSLDLNCTFGGPGAEFTTFGSAGGPSGGDNSFHVNLFFAPTYKKPSGGAWNAWGRSIFYVTDVDAFYQRIVGNGLKPEAPPQDASWGERYFQILDPMGHELSFAKPVAQPLPLSAASPSITMV